MNLLDWVLLVIVVLYAVSGYWQGFITGAFATAGLLAGGIVGVWLAPTVLGNASPSILVSLAAVFIVIVCASLGQALCQVGGARLREKITWQPVRALDAVGGAVLSGSAALVVAWALGVALSGSGLHGITPLVQNSAVLGEVNKILPAEASSKLSAFNDVVGTTFFPRYLEPFAPERIVPVGPGPHRMLTDPDVQRAGAGVVRIRSTNRCHQGIEGSGFVYAPDRVMTNAHVVAGVSSPTVEIRGTSVPARVVYYNPELDLAVLSLPTGTVRPLHFDNATGGEGIAILGFPQNGPYDVQAGRVRADQRLRSPDIYGHGTVIRDVLSLRGLIRPGNSGGPVVDSAGHVVGVVFAASVTSGDTGYALSAQQVAAAAATGRLASRTVSTQGCAA
ncbi:MAG TPA: MarP family serine protease [Nocardioides sp.]|uniref:MarP family serine protease n=1 Tax=Nocardioides sp. TaxID=35761 RepID=UPI002E35EE65|nr:MarP family serine protease [Nocardioides sp.]HEX3932409.1 MarP family serine protease [Nocardioides sp.]